ncbi:hypothetical protein Trydic_g21553 [Trypoxylus dichotomus]
MKLNIICYVDERSVGSLLDVSWHYRVSYSSVHKTLEEFECHPRSPDFFPLEILKGASVQISPHNPASKGAISQAVTCQ